MLGCRAGPTFSAPGERTAIVPQPRASTGDTMVRSAIVALVGFCTRRPVSIFLIALILAGGSTVYAVRHFALKTDVNDLISPNVAWARRGAQLLKDFPQPQIIVVVDAPTSELVDQAAAKLAEALRRQPDRFLSVIEPDSGTFFERNGLLFLPDAQVAELTGELRSANPFIGSLAADPSLRGALDALSLALMGVQFGQLKLDDLVVPVNMASDTADAVLAGRPASFSWRALADRKPPRRKTCGGSSRSSRSSISAHCGPAMRRPKRSRASRRTSISPPRIRRGCARPVRSPWTTTSSARSARTQGLPWPCRSRSSSSSSGWRCDRFGASRRSW
jgi:hypothetical protein